MRKSEFLNLNLQDGTDRYSIASFNQNFTLIDNAVSTLSGLVKGAKLPVLHQYTEMAVGMATTIERGE